MIINDKEALKRLNSPMNLINSLKDKKNSRKSAMSLFIRPSIKTEEIKEEKKTFNPFSSKVKEIDRSEEPKEAVINISGSEISSTEIATTAEINTGRIGPGYDSLGYDSSRKDQDQIKQTQTKLDDLITNHESQIKLTLAHDSALELLTQGIRLLSQNLDEVKADKLPSVIASASKVVESIRKEKNEQSKNGKDRDVHYHFYTPTQKKIDQYEVIDVGMV